MYGKRNLRKAAELGIALTAITSLVLAGCGGGSGAGGAATASATVTPFKGPFAAGATVTLRDANGNLVSLLSGGTINASGVADVTYSANVAYPLIVEVAGSYFNENTGAQETATAPLRGLIAAAASSVPVTIVTETAVADLQNRLGGFAPAHPIQAASAVAALSAAGAMLGIPASALPVFDPASRRTSDPDTLRLAAWAVAANGQAGATLVDRVRALAQSFAAMNPASAPVDVISQVAYNSALSAVTTGASSVMAADANAPSAPTIPVADFAALYASAVAAAGAAGGTASANCNTALFSGGVRNPTPTELTSHARTYTGNFGSFDASYNFVSVGAATLVFGADATLTYNGHALPVSSVCYETGVPQLVVHFGTAGHVDFKTDGSFTGIAMSGEIIKSAAAGGAPAPTITGFSPASGAVGTSITVTGTNLVMGFPPAPTFKFGATNAGVPYTNVSNTGITFTVPAGLAAGNYPLTIGGIGGTPMTVGTFTVTAGGGQTGSSLGSQSGGFNLAGISSTNFTNLIGNYDVVIFRSPAAPTDLTGYLGLAKLEIRNAGSGKGAMELKTPNGTLISRNSNDPVLGGAGASFGFQIPWGAYTVGGFNNDQVSGYLVANFSADGTISGAAGGQSQIGFRNNVLHYGPTIPAALAALAGTWTGPAQALTCGQPPVTVTITANGSVTIAGQPNLGCTPTTVSSTWDGNDDYIIANAQGGYDLSLDSSKVGASTSGGGIFLKINHATAPTSILDAMTHMSGAGGDIHSASLTRQ